MDDEKTGLNFHYSREERLSMTSRSPGKRTGKFFRKKKLSLFIIILEVVIILLIVASIPKLMRTDQKTVSPYIFKLSGFVYDGKPLVSLSINLKPKTPNLTEAEEINVLFSLGDMESRVYQFCL